MKDYYKILGIKENTSEEEIRRRWIELMRQLHPDQQIEEKGEDKRVKDINEAYQVLKHSSTRVKYDLKRMYDRKKRGLYLKRLSHPISILIVFLIFGIIYFKGSQVPIQPKPITQNKINPTSKILDEIATSPIAPSKSGAAVKVKKEVFKPPLPSFPLAKGKLKSDEKPSIPTVLKSEMPVKVENVIPDEMSKGVPQEIVKVVIQEDQIKPINQKAPKDQIAQIIPLTSPIPPAIASEEEARRFFVNYIEQYTQKNIDGFLSLFSLKAVQNQKDGIEGIRKIYNHFLNQSQDIRYHMEDVKTEIYENGVEVKARYEVDQVLKKGGGRKIWRGRIRWTLVKEHGALKILSLDYQHQKTP